MTQRLTGVRLLLRKRKSIEEQRGDEVARAGNESAPSRIALGMEMRLEEFLEHRGRDAVAPARRQRRENCRNIEVALVVGAKITGASIDSRRFSPVTVSLIKSRVIGIANPASPARRMTRAATLQFQVFASKDSSRRAAGARSIFARSATLYTPVKTASSMVALNCCSSSTSSSTRSSELSPS